ncbi:formate dehydrogenase accessory protein FdhE [Pyrodictium abyssi]|uniref:FdhE central domain-containing protein n=1 Tax=Pyrodictium abyssi TaxID=54256 RepID=A0ABM8IWL5_9CREN|nr:hypothetical protein PABY_15090 [Pyrodictium abyssi]
MDDIHGGRSALLRSKLPEIEGWIERLSEQDHRNAQSYRVLRALYRAQARIEEEALRRLEESGLVEEVAKAARRIAFQRLPLIVILGGLPEPLMDEEFLRRSMLEIMDAVEKEGYSLEGAAASLREPVEKAALSLSRLVGELLEGREDSIHAWAGAVSADRDRVRALALWLIQPLLSALRVAASGALGWVREYWQQGLCPVCGSATRVGYMRGEGRRRFLRCQVCGMEWVFPRARCPYCGADSPGDVVFYRPLESRQWLRLYRCRRCGAYWKIVDEEDEAAAERGLPPRELYDAYTFVLDAVAEMLASKRR